MKGGEIAGTFEMQLRNDRYTCAHCGAVLDLPLDASPKVMIKAASGKPTVRVLSIKGDEIHRCEMPTK
jgi:hypothetical protein